MIRQSEYRNRAIKLGPAPSVALYMDPKPIGPPARAFPTTAHTATLVGRESSAHTALVLALIAVVIWLFDAVAILFALAH